MEPSNSKQLRSPSTSMELQQQLVQSQHHLVQQPPQMVQTQQQMIQPQQQNLGIYRQMNSGGMNTIQQHNSNVSINNTNISQQIGQQNQLQQQIGQQNQLQQQIWQQSRLHQKIELQNRLQLQILLQGQLSQQQTGQQGQLSHSALMGQTGHSSLLSGQPAAAAQFNSPNQFLDSTHQKASLMQGSQFHTANSAGQSLQPMGSLNLSSQVRENVTLPYTTQQRMAAAQMRQHISQQNALNASQNPTRTPLLNAQISGLAQNGQQCLMQNALFQQQPFKLMPSMSSPNSSSSFHLQQYREKLLLREQQLASSKLHQDSMRLYPRQLSELTQKKTQMGHPQKQPQQQQTVQQQQLFHQQQSPMMAEHGQKSVSLMGSQLNATASEAAMPGGSSSRAPEASNHILGKRKIQDLVSQVDVNGKLDPDVEDLLLEMADNFIDSVTSFACNMAKNRKSSTLEPKDVLLHLEKNWNLTVPGFSSEEKKHVSDHPTSDAHKKRQDAIHGLMDPVQSEANTAAKQMMRQGPTNQVSSNHMMSPSPSSEQLDEIRSQMLPQNTKF